MQPATAIEHEQSNMISKSVFALCVFSLSVNAAASQVYHCKDAQGKKSFQSTPCESTTLKVQQAKSAGGGGKATSSGNHFHGIPIHPSAQKKEITEDKSIPVATMRYIAPISRAQMVDFYKRNISVKYKEEDLGDTIMLSYKIDGLNRMVSIQDYFGLADVTLGTEK
ncbi:DUF4124 domain-containing protein [Chitiniphilus purpureus]|uniref:DUF4124 domain-containing protein n=1 Tax=Chitiniphilus purpureus TaxID=2981137 RepID=A0ABY6DRR9_9NEIS|nr:DUF4124 domain-containing protein [Chitiniphilus sp. CD1]UXY16923.1 DUF4124 domain-containing protein [Chitiniphilus sp. CD1]